MMRLLPMLAVAALGATAGGTDDEAREYALREAASPETGAFVGGDCGFAIFVVLVAALVVLILYLNKEGKI